MPDCGQWYKLHKINLSTLNFDFTNHIEQAFSIKNTSDIMLENLKYRGNGQFFFIGEIICTQISYDKCKL